MGKKDGLKENVGMTKQLAEFVCGLNFERIPSEVVDQAKVGIMDCIGVALFGSTHSNSKKINTLIGMLV